MRPSALKLSASVAKAVEPEAMAFVRTGLKQAMRAGNSTQKNTFRSVMAAVKNANIAKPNSVVTDVAFAGVLNSLLKTRLNSAEEYEKSSREDLASAEKAEAEVLVEILSHIDLATPEELDTRARNLVDSESDKSFKALMSRLPKDVESEWRAPKSQIVATIRRHARGFSTSSIVQSHENPLGLRRRTPRTATGPQQPTHIPGVKKVVLVASGKGGVGKSTVAVNLALGLAGLGRITGILDADIFGPSLPNMLGLLNAKEPELMPSGKVSALQNHGIRGMSMGFLVPAARSISWRGLLVQKALQQLLWEVDWGAELDYLVVDMPPGTGDVPLTIAQQVRVDGAILVSTPQDVALADVKRGLDMFHTLKLPVLGLVQNMASFTCPCCHTETEIFGPPKSLPDLEVLAKIPLRPDIATAMDAGKMLNDSMYTALAARVDELLQI